MMDGLSHQTPQRLAPPSGNKRCFNVSPQLHLINLKHTLQQINCLHLLVVLPGSQIRQAGQDVNVPVELHKPCPA